MAFDEILADRVRSSLAYHLVACVEKRMMGGLCFMVSGKMCLGVVDQRLMVRLDPEIYADSLNKTGCTPMDFTGKPMRGFVFVRPEGHRSKKQLESWIELALEFNPRAKASQRRRTAGKSSSRRSRTGRTSGRNKGSAT
ncbi:MAG: TfoX/Sxy family protein [Planctomycetaceae bacterium]|nr:TfoX/Sxy family protein [Planctomycetaceae bacterium]